MKETKYICDSCGLPIDGKTTPNKGDLHMVGEDALCVLRYVEGSMGNNKIPFDGWHYHYLCFLKVVDAINSIKS